MSHSPATASLPRRWCSFLLGDACFAVAAEIVVEVLRGRPLARVPLAARGVLGLIHLRGRIVPVIDPAVSLAVPREQRTPSGPHLVIELGDDWYGLLVDEMLALSNFKVGAQAFRHPAKQEAGRPAPMRGHLSSGAPRAGRETLYPKVNRASRARTLRT